MCGRRGTPWDQYQLTESGLYLSDNTIADVSTARHGLTPKLPNDSTKFLRGDGSWATVGALPGTLPDWVDGNPETLGSYASYNSTKTDLFNAGSLDAKWTKVGKATLGTTFTNNVCRITGVGTSGVIADASGMEQSAPSTPYTLIMRVRHLTRFTFGICGLHVRDSTSGKFWVVHIYRNNTNYADQYRGVSKYASFTNRTGTAGLETTSSGEPLWFKLVNDGTNLTGSSSYDGIYWDTILTETIATHFGGSPTIDKVGIMTDAFSTVAGEALVYCFIVV